jgi:hypothetical protein
MRRMKVWFPEFFTEAHRKPGEGDVLAEELRKFGIDCQLNLTEDCSFIFCGTIWRMNLVKEERQRFPDIPTIHYNWDLYPFQLIPMKTYRRATPDLWAPYLEEIATCRDIWVPSQCTVDRTREFVGRSDSVVIKTSVRPWEYGRPVTGGYAVDVMRKYPDPNRDLAAESCVVMGIPIIETKTATPWEAFKTNIAESRFLISAQFEASTGGLTLMEGYWHGKPALISNSPRHGGIDYFGDRATYFQWDNPVLFRQALCRMYDNTPVVDIDEARTWIMQEYSEYAMASRMAERFWELYDESR